MPEITPIRKYAIKYMIGHKQIAMIREDLKETLFCLIFLKITALKRTGMTKNMIPEISI